MYQVTTRVRISDQTWTATRVTGSAQQRYVMPKSKSPIAAECQTSQGLSLDDDAHTARSLCICSLEAGNNCS